MASASQDGQIILWNLTNGLPIASLNNHTTEIGYALGLIVDSMDTTSPILVSGGRDKWINLWNVSTGQLIKRFYTDKDVYALSLMVINCGERNLW
jgi:WD40 repeat protein